LEVEGNRGKINLHFLPIFGIPAKPGAKSNILPNKSA
jgi:hypothetical protein